MPALISAINKGLVLRGVSAAKHNSLLGPVVHERTEVVHLPVAGQPSVTVHMRVVRSSMTGLLDFYYRLAMQESDYDHALRLSLSFGIGGVMISFADFRIDSPGTAPPNYFESDPAEPAIFRFDFGLAAGRGSYACFISTNAREYREGGGTGRLTCHSKKSVTFDVPGPISLVAVMPPRSESIQEAIPAQCKDLSDN